MNTSVTLLRNGDLLSSSPSSSPGYYSESPLVNIWERGAGWVKNPMVKCDVIWSAFHVTHLAENNIFLLEKFQCRLVLGWCHVVTFLVVNRCTIIIIIFIITGRVGEESAQNPCVPRVPWQLTDIHVIRRIWFPDWIFLVLVMFTIRWNFLLIIFAFFLLMILRLLFDRVVKIENCCLRGGILRSKLSRREFCDKQKCSRLHSQR